jgi:hypothetical protein
VNHHQFAAEQEGILALFKQWLESLPESLRKRLLLVYNTARIVSDAPASEVQSGHLPLAGGVWPEALFSGLVQPDVLISRNGRRFDFFNTPGMSQISVALRQQMSTWPPDSSDFREVVRVITGLLDGEGQFSPRTVMAVDQRNNMRMLRELATSCSAHMRTFQGGCSSCQHVYIYDPLINKGTALYRLLIAMHSMGYFPSGVQFVTGGDSFPDLPMLIPSVYVSGLSQENHRLLFGHSAAVSTVSAWHAGSVLSMAATGPMLDAINAHGGDGAQVVRAYSYGLPGIIRQALKLLEKRFNVFSL